MIITVHRSPEGVRSIEIRAADAAEVNSLYWLAESARRSARLTLDTDDVNIVLGPFGAWHADQLKVIDPPPHLTAWGEVHQAEGEPKP